MSREATFAAELALWRVTGEASSVVCEQAVADHLAGRAVDYLPEAATTCWTRARSQLDGGLPSYRMVMDHGRCDTCRTFSDAVEKCDDEDERRTDDACGALARLHDAQHPLGDGVEPDWTRIRALVDHLRLHPNLIPYAVVEQPPPSGNERLDNLLAAVAEKLSDDQGMPRPHWTTSVAPLAEPWESNGTPAMRDREAAAAPPQFLARNIKLAVTNVWRRDPGTSDPVP